MGAISFVPHRQSQVRIAGISFERAQLVEDLSGILKPESVPGWAILIL
jgi:hypothetical protein